MADKKFDQFQTGGEVRFGDIVVGLRSSDLTKNYQFDFPGTGIKDVNGNYIFQYASVGVSSVNFPKLVNSFSGAPALFTAEGLDTDIGISIQPKNNGSLILDELTWPVSDGVANSFLKTDGAGNLSFTSGSVVISATGTANQVLINGTSGTPETGDLTFTTPQDIATTSTPTFNNLKLTGGVIRGTNNNTVLEMLDLASAVNYVHIGNNTTGSGPSVSAKGSDSDIPLTLSTKGNSPIAWITSALTQPVLIYSGTSNQHLTRFNMSNTAADRSVTFQDSSGTLAYLTDIPDVWVEVTGSAQQMSPNINYIANNGGGAVTFTLPTTAALGTYLKIVGKGAGWVIAQNLGQSIKISGSSTSSGPGGGLTSTAQFDSINLVCITANTTWAADGGVQGNITIF